LGYSSCVFLDWHMAQIRIESQLDREQLEAIGELGDLSENISKDN